MSEENAVVVFVTASSKKEAQKISDLLLQKRKAACVNIVSNVDSMFWWESKLEFSKESLLIIKTKSSVLPQVIELVKQAHSYTTPEVIVLPIIDGNADYLKWMNEEIREL